MRNACSVRAAREGAYDETLMILFLLDALERRLSSTAIGHTRTFLTTVLGNVRRRVEDHESGKLGRSAFGATWELLRTCHSVAGCLLRETTWQSPFGSSVNSNDYKRAWHSEGDHYEKSFAREYYQGPCRFLPECRLTCSGMAALTTMIGHWNEQFSEHDVVLVDRNVYHESSYLVRTLSRPRIVEVDCDDPHALSRALSTIEPKALFLETLSNSYRIRSVSLTAVVEVINDLTPTDFSLYLDNTGGTFLWPELSSLHTLPCSVPVVIVESLAKYHQYGMDLVTGGVLIIDDPMGNALESLTRVRTHLGTNTTDIAAATLPDPSFEMNKRRLDRIGRNARIAATRFASDRTAEVTFSGLHVTGERSFRGGCVNIGLHASGGELRAIVDRAMGACAEQRIPLRCGTSFGFSTSRLYVVESSLEGHRPFLRFSAGTEEEWELRRILDAIGGALQLENQGGRHV
jgi:cystathionine beta-lyase/cystathionine gamma-synthase